MVMYISNVVSKTLILDYEKTPSASEVISDILNAPIEYGENFQNKKRGRNNLIVKDEKIFVNAELGKKALEEIFKSEKLVNAGFKFTNEKNNLDPKFIYVPEEGISEQTLLM